MTVLTLIATYVVEHSLVILPLAITEDAVLCEEII